MPQRQSQLAQWLTDVLGHPDFHVAPASGDASQRRYWRVRQGGQRYVAMDTPPCPEDTQRYVRIAERLAALGLHTPDVHAQAHDQGFLLLEDLGETHYLDALSDTTVDRLYGDALGALAVVQACAPVDDLPPYDGPFLARELDIFREWLVEGMLGLVLDSAEEESLRRAFAVLVASALEQPRVCVHRDFHSRNLMVTPSPSPGILDFQDAVVGPVTYDLVSLLRDCYIAWPADRVHDWAIGYFDLAVQSGILTEDAEGRFLRWLDLMGVQRHLKAAGIFARLKLRDGKPGYLREVPRTLGYVLKVCGRYPELGGLGSLVEGRVLPAFGEACS